MSWYYRKTGAGYSIPLVEADAPALLIIWISLHRHGGVVQLVAEKDNHIKWLEVHMELSVCPVLFSSGSSNE